MNDWGRTLRGCVSAYAAGVIVIGVVNAVGSRDAEVIWVVALFGLIAVLPCVIAALIVTAILRRNRAKVSMMQGIGICAGTFTALGVLVGVVDGGLLTLALAAITAFGIGAAFGLVFWVGAYGLRRSVQFGADEAE